MSLGQFSEMDRLKVSQNVTIRIGILLAIGLLAATGCSGKMPAAVQPQPPKVTVAKPEERLIVDYVEFPGQTDAVGEVEVRARVTGYIVKIHFEDGQEVKQGDVLFEIDPRPYQMALNRATGELARLRALSETAKVDVSRTERLRPSGAVSEDEYEHAVAELKVQQAAIQTAEAVLEEAKLNLEFTRVVSPIDGRVSRRRVTEGNLVQNGLRRIDRADHGGHRRSGLRLLPHRRADAAEVRASRLAHRR